MKYRECGYCGSSLDFGEKCDCAQAVARQRAIREYQNKAIRYSGYQVPELKQKGA